VSKKSYIKSLINQIKRTVSKIRKFKVKSFLIRVKRVEYKITSFLINTGKFLKQYFCEIYRLTVKIAKATKEERLNSKLKIKQVNKQLNNNGFSASAIALKSKPATKSDVDQSEDISCDHPYLPVESYDISPEVISLVPAEVVRQHHLIPIDRFGHILIIAMSNPLNIQAITTVEKISKCVVRAFISSHEEIQRQIDKNYIDSTDLLGRRRHTRLKVNVQSPIIIKNDLIKKIELKDISPRGICGVTKHPIEIDDQVQVILFYPFFEEPVKKNARVVWYKCNGKKDTREVGFDFGHNSELDLSHYIKHNSHK
jgi:hypothetical protein